MAVPLLTAANAGCRICLAMVKQLPPILYGRSRFNHKDATFRLEAEGTSEADASRVGFADAGNFRLRRKERFCSFWKERQNSTPMKAKPAKMNVEGYRLPRATLTI